MYVDQLLFYVQEINATSKVTFFADALWVPDGSTLIPLVVSVFAGEGTKKNGFSGGVPDQWPRLLKGPAITAKHAARQEAGRGHILQCGKGGMPVDRHFMGVRNYIRNICCSMY